MTPDEHERLTRLEVKVGTVHETLDKVSDNVMELRADINKAKGMIGGMLFTVSALWAFVIGAWRYFKE